MNYNKFEKLYISCVYLCSIIIIVYIVLYYNKSYTMSLSSNIHILNEFKITAYCPCVECNTLQWKGKLANGYSMKEYFKNNINVAAIDPKVIPLGSTIIYNNKKWLAVDTGVKRKHIDLLIDLLFKTYKETIQFGVKYNQIIIIK